MITIIFIFIIIITMTVTTIIIIIMYFENYHSQGPSLLEERRKVFRKPSKFPTISFEGGYRRNL